MTPLNVPSSADHYEALVAAVVKATPDSVEEKCANPNCKCKREFLSGRPITLEDVLRALEACIAKYDDQHDPHGRECFVEGIVDAWFLGHDLAWHRDNAPETIEFLFNPLADTAKA